MLRASNFTYKTYGTIGTMYESYLREGPLTTFTPNIISLAEKVSGEGVTLLQDIFRISRETLKSKAKARDYFKDETHERLYQEHQRRTVDDILDSEYTWGCGDFGMLFATIARYKGIPAKYIQCTDVMAYISFNGTTGHVYVECYLPEGTYLVDSIRGEIVNIKEEKDKQQLYSFENKGRKYLFVECFSGLDPRDAGITTHEEMFQSLVKANEEYLRVNKI